MYRMNVNDLAHDNGVQKNMINLRKGMRSNRVARLCAEVAKSNLKVRCVVEKCVGYDVAEGSATF